MKTAVDRMRYEQLAEQFRLASKEIYSRFGAMLIANSIIITLLGFKYPALPKWFAILLSVLGVALCLFWWWLNEHGIHYQKQYRREIIDMENAVHNFKVFGLIREEEFQNKLKKNTYPTISRGIIIVFMLIYVALICLYATHEGSGQLLPAP